MPADSIDFIYIQCNQSSSKFILFCFLLFFFSNLFSLMELMSVAWTDSRNATTDGSWCYTSSYSKGQQHGTSYANVHIWNCCFFRLHNNEGEKCPIETIFQRKSLINLNHDFFFFRI